MTADTRLGAGIKMGPRAAPSQPWRADWPCPALWPQCPPCAMGCL